MKSNELTALIAQETAARSFERIANCLALADACEREGDSEGAALWTAWAIDEQASAKAMASVARQRLCIA